MRGTSPAERSRSNCQWLEPWALLGTGNEVASLTVPGMTATSKSKTRKGTESVLASREEVEQAACDGLVEHERNEPTAEPPTAQTLPETKGTTHVLRERRR